MLGKKIVLVWFLSLISFGAFALSEDQIARVQRNLNTWNVDNEGYWNNIPLFTGNTEEEAKEYIDNFLEASLMLDRSVKKFREGFSEETDWVKEAQELTQVTVDVFATKIENIESIREVGRALSGFIERLAIALQQIGNNGQRIHNTYIIINNLNTDSLYWLL